MSEETVPKQQYTEEFRTEAVRLAESVGGHEAARRLGIPSATLSNWFRRRRKAPGKETIESAPSRYALLVLDQAGWHTTPKLPQLPNVSLLSLPAGSPALNSAEQVWQQLRDRDLANRCYDSDEHIVDACCEAWNKFIQIPGAIRSLCAQLGKACL